MYRKVFAVTGWLMKRLENSLRCSRKTEAKDAIIAIIRLVFIVAPAMQAIYQSWGVLFLLIMINAADVRPA
jgi:hypothetical protein